MTRVIVTEDWTTFELVRYLVSVRSTLTPLEIERLSDIPTFRKEGAGKEYKVQLHKAKVLYEPIDVFRELGLPIIDWGTDNQWEPLSNEGKFLVNCSRSYE